MEKERIVDLLRNQVRSDIQKAKKEGSYAPISDRRDNDSGSFSGCAKEAFSSDNLYIGWRCYCEPKYNILSEKIFGIKINF